MSYYKHHVFVCTNQRENSDRPSCEECGANGLREHLKKRVKELGLAGKGGVRVNNAGCLDRCEEGPSAVVYPEATWWTLPDDAEAAAALAEHLR